MRFSLNSSFEMPSPIQKRISTSTRPSTGTVMQDQDTTYEEEPRTRKPSAGKKGDKRNKSVSFVEEDENSAEDYGSESDSEGLANIDEYDDMDEDELDEDDDDDDESDEDGLPSDSRKRKERRSSKYSDAVVGKSHQASVQDAYARAATIPPTPITPSLQRLKGFAQRRRTSIVFPTVQRQRRPLRRKTSTRAAVPAHLKQSMLKSIARSVTDMPFRVEALGVLAHQCQELMDSYVMALETVADYHHRNKIELVDVEFLLHEASLIEPKQSLTDTMRKELPEELVEKMIPIARAQNVITPKPHSSSSSSSR